MNRGISTKGNYEENELRYRGWPEHYQRGLRARYEDKVRKERQRATKPVLASVLSHLL